MDILCISFVIGLNCHSVVIEKEYLSERKYNYTPKGLSVYTPKVTCERAIRT